MLSAYKIIAESFETSRSIANHDIGRLKSVRTAWDFSCVSSATRASGAGSTRTYRAQAPASVELWCRMTQTCSISLSPPILGLTCRNPGLWNVHSLMTARIRCSGMQGRMFAHGFREVPELKPEPDHRLVLCILTPPSLPELGHWSPIETYKASSSP